ncbi:NACHT domain-containing protein [Streptomyces mutabilis]|uniref:NACHT domain-containing protein n=1 Tax=Streptomyces mutabilis TaxID=67332 RepID=UPI000A4F4016|nr:hypothetical protein [Streptomyces mutabilis]
MTNRDVALFVRRWHEAGDADPAPGEALLDAVRTKQDLGRLVTNPLMCALVCTLHRERRDFLPRGRKALYDAALSMLLERRDRERELTVELSTGATSTPTATRRKSSAACVRTGTNELLSSSGHRRISPPSRDSAGTATSTCPATSRPSRSSRPSTSGTCGPFSCSRTARSMTCPS